MSIAGKAALRGHPALAVGLVVVIAATGAVVTPPDEYPVTAVLFLALGALVIVLVASGRQAGERAIERTEELRAIEVQLRASEQRYRSVLDATTSIVAVTDAQGRFVEPQPAWESYTGQPWAAHRDYAWIEGFHPDDRVLLLDAWRRNAPRSDVYENRIRLWHAASDGYRYVVVRGAAVPDDDGNVREWIGTVSDVHERTLGDLRRAGAAQLRSAVLGSLQDGLVVTDRHGAVIEVNDAWERMTGFTRVEALAARPPYPWWPGEHEHPAAWRAIEQLNDHMRTTARPVEREVSYRHRAGHLVPTITSIAAVLDSDRVRLVITSIKDITERKAGEEALRSERDFRDAIVASLQEGLFVLSRDGEVREVNEAWTHITGFERNEVVGVRPPYPWWPTDPAVRERLAKNVEQAVQGEVSGEIEITIARADGEPRLVVVNRQPVHDPSTGEFVAVVGTFRDVTRRAAAENRLRTFAALTARLATYNDVAGVAGTILAELMPAIGADAGAVAIVDSDAQVFGVVAEAGLSAEALRRWRRVSLDHPGPLSEVVRTGETCTVATPEELERRFPAIAAGTRDRGIQSFVVLPLARATTVSGMLFLGFKTARTVSSGDASLLEGVAPIVAQALERARLFEFQRSVASTLQHAMLSDPPIGTPNFAVAARYQPAVTELEVGGDWFDVLPLPGDRIAVVTGDIVGRGLPAAAVMGQLRSALGALAATTPSAIEAIARLDHFARRVPGAKATTLCYGIVDIAASTLRFTAAGHPPPLLVEADGRVRFLDQAHGWPLGVADPAITRPEAVVSLPPGSTLVFYTDGLVERRGDRLEAGMDRLAEHASAFCARPVEQLCDELLRAIVPEQPTDDIALVALRLVSTETDAFTYRVPAAPTELVGMRRQLRTWLSRHEFSPDLNEDVVLAVGEACTNAIEHAYTSDGSKSVVVEAHCADDELVLMVRDYGAWRPLAPDPRRNRGLDLIAAVMDDVSVDAAPNGGTRVRMTRKI